MSLDKPPEIEEKPPAPTPLGDHALARLQRVANGNGMTREQITLLGSEEQELHVEADLRLSLEITRDKQEYAGGFQGLTKKSTATPTHAVQSMQQIEAAVDDYKKKLTEAGDWISQAYAQIRAEPGEGWGLEDVDVTLDDLMHVYYTTAVCQQCSGRGTTTCPACHGARTYLCPKCNGMGQELCYDCRGTGLYAGNTASDAQCPTCRGSTLAICRTCNGHKHVPCGECKGQGALACVTCNGQGKFTHEESLLPVAQCSFHIKDSSDLPSGFRRAISRGGLRVLTKGYASISAQAVNSEDKENVFIPYRATLPYAEARIKTPEQTMRIIVFGLKKALLDVPPFLDKAIEASLQEWDARADDKETLDKALKWRVIADIFALMQQGKTGGKDLFAQYPYGFSKDMLSRLQRFVQKAVRGGTAKARYMAGAGNLVFLSLVVALVIKTDARASLLTLANKASVAGFDVALVLSTFIMGLLTAKAASAHALKKRLGQQAVGVFFKQSLHITDIALSLVPGLFYFILIALWPSHPNWFAALAN